MNKRTKKITVCGAGQGGHAIAAHMSLCGNQVTLYTHTPIKEAELKRRDRVISVSGILSGDARLAKVTTDLEDAVEGSEIVFICTDSTVHKYYARNIAGHVDDQHVILISPGVGGALSFLKEIRENNRHQGITVSETDTLPYACKVPMTGKSHIKAIKESIIYTSLPEAADTSGLDSFFEEVYPQFRYVNNPLMGLDDSPVFHIVGMVMNADRILNNENFNFYIDGITPEYAEIMEKMDEERCSVAEAVGITPRPVKEWLSSAYDISVEDRLYDMIQKTPPYMNTPEVPNRSPAPMTLFHRYLLEEIPLRAVPTIHIAETFGIKTPIYEEMVSKACRLTGINFWKTGRTLREMGLKKSELEEFRYIYDSE